MKIVGIIPCRYGAVRFPGKSLADIHGKPMMWHVYQQALKSELLQDVFIATDDDRIMEACAALDLNAIKTRDDHPTGTDRLAECVASVDSDIYVNVQGDEPMIAPEAIDRVARAIVESDDPDTLASNGFNDIHLATDVIDTNVVKVIMDIAGRALMYSRQPIPYPKDGPVQYHRQLGLYAFRKSGLETFASEKPGPVEAAEGIEMLRFLEHGYRVAMVRVPDDDGIPVDTPADLQRVREMLAK
jgi:3-deoxy-manno-octulosonate cytidylyltransferase (CMP-KDO synthetase)